MSTVEVPALLADVLKDIKARPAAYEAGRQLLARCYPVPTPDKAQLSRWEKSARRWAAQQVREAKWEGGRPAKTDREQWVHDRLERLQRMDSIRAFDSAVTELPRIYAEEHTDARAQAMLILGVMVWDLDAETRSPVLQSFGEWGNDEDAREFRHLRKSIPRYHVGPEFYGLVRAAWATVSSSDPIGPEKESERDSGTLGPIGPKRESGERLGTEVPNPDFEPEGGAWRVSYRAGDVLESRVLGSSKGLGHIARLLQSPHRPIEPREFEPPTAELATVAEVTDEMVVDRVVPTGMDFEAKRALYRERGLLRDQIEQLERDIEEHQRMDETEAARAAAHRLAHKESELMKIEQHLNGKLVPEARSSQHKLKAAVWGALTRAFDRLEQSDLPRLAEYLRDTVRQDSGRIVYRPPVMAPAGQTVDG
ncbi:MAG TPA: hypothetical protein VEA69_23575 [Tepidisphaeraceae bacterium]|nr:hypothetical protein [Tepidisphaeraceae bacterium]